MAKENNYVVIVKQLESGKYLLTFPDFEGITTTAETEETIPTIAGNTIKNKLSEIKKAGIEISEPKKMKDVVGTLKDGEFTTFVNVSSFTFDLKGGISNISNKENIDNIKKNAKEVNKKVDNFIKSDVKSFIPEGKENLLGILAGIISIINTIFFSVVVIDAMFFGKYRIKFFGGLSEFSSFSKDVKTLSVVLMFSGIILLIMAAGIIYFSIVKNRDFIKYIIFSKAGFLLLFYIVLFIKIPSEASQYISVSFLKIFLYIICIILAYITYILIPKTENKEEI